MKILYVFFTMLLSTLVANGQQFKYIRISSAQAGVSDDKPKLIFTMPNQPDSTKYYNNLKINDITLAVELMERKGYELLSITPMSHTVGIGVLIITTAYMRKKIGTTAGTK